MLRKSRSLSWPLGVWEEEIAVPIAWQNESAHLRIVNRVAGFGIPVAGLGVADRTLTLTSTIINSIAGSVHSDTRGSPIPDSKASTPSQIAVLARAEVSLFVRMSIAESHSGMPLSAMARIWAFSFCVLGGQYQLGEVSADN